MRQIYTIDELRVAVKDSICYTDVCRSLDVSVCTFNFKRIQKLCEEHNISLTHFDRKRAFRRNKFEWTFEKIFCEKSKIGRCSLRKACVRFGLYTGKCADCNVADEWQGKPLTIEVDHINGISDDNRPENLRWLCPNCHSQTPTYRRRHDKRVTDVT